MPKDSPKHSRALKNSKSLWFQSCLAIAANALVLSYLAEGAVELLIGAALTSILTIFAWRSYAASKKVSEDSVATESQLQFVFDSIPIGIHWAIYRQKGKEAFAEERFYNPAHLKISGMTEEEMNSPGSFTAITHPDDIERQKEVRKQLTEGNMKEVALEKRYLRKDGNISWVKVSWKRQYDEDGKGFQEFSCIIDITETKEANETIKRKEKQLRTIFESVPIGLHWSDVEVPNGIEDKNFLERIVNPAHNTLTGLNEEQSKIPGIYDEISFPEDLEIQKKGISETIDKGSGSFSMDKRYIRKDGSIIWASINWIRTWDENKKRYQEISTLVDITEQKQFAEKLEQARIAAEEANLSKSQFLATMSHEIRTPMNGMIGTLHILESQLDEENLKYLKIAQNSANDLLALINDILDFSKIEAGKMELESKEFPINEAIEQASEIHANNAFEKGLHLRNAIEPNAAVHLIGDPLKLRQVLSNLLSNAIKFTERGEIVLGARLISETETEDTIEIYVQDTGIGLSPQEKEKLFHAFTQANASTTRRYGGTGLGLSICKSIVEHMHGRIGVESEPGKGSTFWIRFPNKDLSPVEDLQTPLPQETAKKVLIVENYQSTAAYIQKWLTLWGCESQTATNPAEAIDLIGKFEASTQLDLLILDAAQFNKSENTWKELFANNAVLRTTKTVLLERLSNERHDNINDDVDFRLNKPIRIQQLKALLSQSNDQSAKVSDKPKTKEVQTFDYSETKLLVVEDVMVNRLVVTKLLEQKHGIKADIATNGLEAIESLKAKHYDIVLMDCMMPEMDGYDATRAIRRGEAGEQNAEIPIIALTANAMEDDQADCLKAGMSDHISKPITPAQIHAVLQKWVQK